MSELRTILVEARNEYREKRYPGDLASRVLPTTADGFRRPRLLLAPLALTGIAAMLVAAVTLQLRPQRTLPMPVLIDPYPADQALVAEETEEPIDLLLPALPAFPETAEIAEDFSIALLPGLPSLSFSAEAFTESQSEYFTETP